MNGNDLDLSSALLMSFYGYLAQKRLAAGLKLNSNESMAILTCQVKWNFVNSFNDQMERGESYQSGETSC